MGVLEKMPAVDSLRLTLLSVTALVGIFYLWRRSKIARSAFAKGGLAPHLQPVLPECKPVHRLKDWTFGLGLAYKAYHELRSHTLLEKSQADFEQHGRTYSRRMGGLNLFATSEPEIIKTVLATEFKSWKLGEWRRLAFKNALGAEGIFGSDGNKWKWTRELLRPCFTTTRVKAVHRFEKHVGRLIETIQKRGASATIDLQPIFSEFSMDVATEFLFGLDLHCLPLEACRPGSESVAMEAFQSSKQGDIPFSVDRLRKFCEAISYVVGSVDGIHESRFGFLGMFLPDLRLRRERSTVKAFAESVVEKGQAEHAAYISEKSETSDYNFLQEMISNMPDKDRMCGEVLNILIAGRDTTAALLSNVLFELSKRPDVWERVQNEVAGLGGRKPTFDDLRDMVYLNALLKESLRLFPIVPGNARQASEDTILPCGGGLDGESPIFVPKGSILHWSTWTMHRREDIYGEDAEKFRPERWLDEGGNKGLRVSWEYLPFNAGPRVCIGQQFATTEACYTIARLAQDFSGIESRDPEPWREKINLTVYNFGGCKIALTPRAG